MSFVTTELQGAVAVVTIDRPKALNALNPEVLADLKAAFEAVDQETVRCIVLTGEGEKSIVAASYTHLTLPTSYLGYIAVVGAEMKPKKIEFPKIKK